MIWDPTLLLIDAAVGALAGLVAWFITRRMRKADPKRAQTICLIAAIVPVVAAQQSLGPLFQTIRDKRGLREAGVSMYGTERGGEINLEETGPVFLQPRFREKLKEKQSSMGPGHAASVRLDNPIAQANADLGALGLARMNGDELQSLIEVKRAMAERSPALCAAFWTGNLQMADLQLGLKGLTEAHQRIWSHVLARSVSLELDARAPAPRISRAVADQAFASLIGRLSSDEQAAFQRATNSPSPTSDEACAAFRALSGHTKDLASGEREAALKALLAPIAVEGSTPG